MAADESLWGQAYNFSTESQLTVTQFVDLIRAAVGRNDIEPDVRAVARHEIQHQHLSAEKARRLLGWKPRYLVEEALALTVEWYQAYLTDMP
jgi:CDP-glucose 4,6-dehydratase